MTTVGKQTDESTGWIAWASSRLWVRLLLLVSVAGFELGLTWFLLHFGWLESINIWTQLGVIAIAVFPLLVAAAFLLRRRFSMKSAFVSLTMFALFMALTFRPVYEAKRLRIPVKQLVAADIEFRDIGVRYETIDGIPSFQRIEAENSDQSQWWFRLLGDDASIPPLSEVYGVQIQDAGQLAAFAKVSGQFPNLSIITLDSSIPNEVLEKHQECFEQSTAVGLNFIPYFGVQKSTTVRNPSSLKWLEGCDHFRVLSFFSCYHAPELFLDWNGAEIESLSFNARLVNSTKLDWAAVIRCKTFQNLKVLSLGGYKLTKAEADELASLQELKSLFLHGVNAPDYQFLGSLTELRKLTIYHSCTLDFSFLDEMASLRELQIVFDAKLTDETIPELPVPAGLRKLTLNAPRAISVQSIDRIRESLPEECELIYHLY